MSILLIHGGAGPALQPQRKSAVAHALSEVLSKTWPVLGQAGSRAAVVRAVQLLEDNPLFNAGLGSKLQDDGEARLSAALMDGARMRFSGVINVCGIRNPILLARKLLEERDRVLSGERALQRARELGMEECDVRTRRRIQEFREALEGQTGTVGAVAVDSAGHLAAATSTGGRGMERKGRVSDSATVAGNYADALGAISCTGIGEDIVDAALAARIVTGLGSEEPLNAVSERCLTLMRSKGWKAGYIAVDRNENWVAHTTTASISWALRSGDREEGFWKESHSE